MSLFVIVQFALFCFSLIGLFLSWWIVIPAPTLSLLPLGIVVLEISPVLVGLNGIVLGGAIASTFFLSPSWLAGVTLTASLISLGLSLIPLIQLPATQEHFATEIDAVLGQNYLKAVPQAIQDQMRPRSLLLTDVLRGITPPEVRIERGITFASPDGVELTLNTYRPLKAGSHPTVIIIYGGAWRQGTPNNDETCSRYLASQGYTIIAIDYRHAPTYKFPAQIEDVRTAIQYIADHTDELEVDRDRVAILGRSAGGHLAMLAGYGQSALPIRAVVNYYAPVNLTNGYYDLPSPDPIDVQAVLRDFLGDTPEALPNLYHQASPWNLIQPNLPPSLLIYAGRDHLVQAKFGRRLHQRLGEFDNLSVFLEVPWAEHAFDAVFSGVSNQLVLYHLERFLAWALSSSEEEDVNTVALGEKD
jgi:acetyl esterase/lipase